MAQPNFELRLPNDLPLDALTGFLDHLFPGARSALESESLFHSRLGEALGGPNWQENLGANSDSVAQLLMNNVDFETRSRRYVGDTMRYLSELSQSLRDPDDRLSKDGAALSALQTSVESLEQNIHRLRKILLDLPTQCDQLQKLIFRLSPPTFTAFCKKYSPLITRLRQEAVDSRESCAVCLGNKVNVRLLRRCAETMCGSDQRPTCVCRPQLCLDCLLTTYWTQTEQERKSYAPCPLCRSPFCLYDIVPLDANSAAALTPNETSPVKRKTSDGRKTSKRIKKN